MKYPREASTTRPVSTPMRKMSQFAESSTAASASRDIRWRLRNNAVYSPNRAVTARSSRHTSQDHTTRCAHRVVWSWLVCLLLLAVTARFGEYTALLRNRQRMSRLALAAVLLSANWLIFLIGVLTGRVVEASLGYFMNPLVTVLLAVVVLRERINRAQWLGLGIAAAGLGVLTYENGRVPWISLGLAFSFGLYGLMKKQVAADVPALAGFTAETTALLPLALGYLAVLTAQGSGTFGVADGPFGTRLDHVLLLMFSGIA